MGESLVMDRSEQPVVVIDVRLLEMGLDPGAFRVYAQLVRQAAIGDEMPGVRAIAEQCGMSQGGVLRAVERLEEMGMVRVNRRHGRGGNQYVITAPSAWVNVGNGEMSSCVNVVAFPDNVRMDSGEVGGGVGAAEVERMHQMESISARNASNGEHFGKRMHQMESISAKNASNGEHFEGAAERGEGGGACTLYVPSSTPQNIKNMYPLTPLVEVSNGPIDGLSSEIENNNHMADLPLFGGDGEEVGGEREEVRRDGPGYSAGFVAFWSAYPKKVGKRAAWLVWQRGKLERLGYEIVKSIERHAAGRRWADGYIPDPRTFLNQGRWEDAVEMAEAGAGRGAFDDVRGGNGLDEL